MYVSAQERIDLRQRQKFINYQLDFSVNLDATHTRTPTHTQPQYYTPTQVYFNIDVQRILQSEPLDWHLKLFRKSVWPLKEPRSLLGSARLASSRLADSKNRSLVATLSHS